VAAASTPLRQANSCNEDLLDGRRVRTEEAFIAVKQQS
jgi:hypothetical protein